MTDRQNIFMMRSNMEPIATNFPNKFNSKNCQLGCGEIETRSHIKDCTLNDEDESKLNIDVFQSSNTVLMASVANNILEIIDKRNMKIELGKGEKYMNIKRSKWSQLLHKKVNPECDSKIGQQLKRKKSLNNKDHKIKRLKGANTTIRSIRKRGGKC